MPYGVHPPLLLSQEAPTVLLCWGRCIFPPRKHPRVVLGWRVSLTNPTARATMAASPAGCANGPNRWWKPREEPPVFIPGVEAERRGGAKRQEGSRAECFCPGLGAHPLLRLPVAPRSPAKHVRRCCCWIYELSSGEEIAFCSVLKIQCENEFGLNASISAGLAKERGGSNLFLLTLP